MIDPMRPGLRSTRIAPPQISLAGHSSAEPMRLAETNHALNTFLEKRGLRTGSGWLNAAARERRRARMAGGAGSQETKKEQRNLEGGKARKKKGGRK